MQIGYSVLLLIFHSTWKLRLWDLVMGLKFKMNLILSYSRYKKNVVGNHQGDQIFPLVFENI